MPLLTIWLLAALFATAPIARAAHQPVPIQDAFQEHFLIGTAVNRSLVTGSAGFRRRSSMTAWRTEPLSSAARAP